MEILTNSLFWSIASTTIALTALWFASRKYYKEKEQDKITFRNNVYAFFYKRYSHERLSISGEGGGIPMGIYDGLERIPFEWIQARPEYLQLSKKELKALKEVYGIH